MRIIRTHLVMRLGGGSIVRGPTDALLLARRDATLTLVLAGGEISKNILLLKGVIHPLAVSAVLESSPDLDRVELHALFNE